VLVTLLALDEGFEIAATGGVIIAGGFSVFNESIGEVRAALRCVSVSSRSRNEEPSLHVLRSVTITLANVSR